MSKGKPWLDLTFDEKMERSGIPDYMRDGIKRWIEDGVYPGSFLTAILENNMADAIQRADSTNLGRLECYVTFLQSYAPRACWGSPERMAKWSRQRFHERATYGGNPPKLTD